MLVVMNSKATSEQVEGVKQKIIELGFKPNDIPGSNRVVIVITGNNSSEDRIYLEELTGVLQVIPITKSYKSIKNYIYSGGT